VRTLVAAGKHSSRVPFGRDGCLGIRHDRAMTLRVHTALVPFGPAMAIELTDDQVVALGGGKRAAVVVTIGARSARLRLAVMDGRNVIGISKANRAVLGVEAKRTETRQRRVEAAVAELSS
jgi:hypothetical protein